jgi:hypothetical protein
MRKFFALVLATPVHAGPVALTALGAWLLWSGTSRWLGIFCLAGAASLLWRPRRRPDPKDSTLDLVSAPESAELLDAVAAAVDAPTPHRLRISRGFGAEVRRRRRRWTITVGAPLWLGLAPEERIALLARALAPYGLAPGWSEQYVHGALTTLDRFLGWLNPDSPGDPMSVYDPIIIAGSPDTIAGRAANRLGTDIVAVLLLPLHLLCAGYRRLLATAAREMTVAHQRSVDAAVATVAGPAAVERLQRDLAHREAIATLAQRAANTGADMQMAVRQRTVRVVDAAELTPGPTIRVSPAHWEAIDAEWSTAVNEQFELLRRDLR